MFKKQDWIMETRAAWHTVVNVVLAVLVIVGFWVAVRADGQSAPDGQALFERRCTGCHALDSDHEGPRLRGVVGRPAGSVKTFQYSDALKNAKHAWNEANLDKWLTDPESLVPDNDMSFRVPKQEERTAIIAYLKSLSTP
jgi:cytochrome c